MKNFEKYEKKIKEYNYNFAVNKNGNVVKCNGFCCDCIISSSCCNVEKIEWLYKEYQLPKIDWNKVEVDTPILVSLDGENWCKRHFAKYKNGKVYTWYNGFTSWTTGEYRAVEWEYAKLVEENND